MGILLKAYRKTLAARLCPSMQVLWVNSPKFRGLHLTFVELHDPVSGEVLARGQGYDKSPYRGSIKAIMEALEMLAIYDSKLGLQTRSGIGAHTDLTKAKMAALSELVERDAFLAHWLTEKPGRLLTDGERRACFRESGSVDGLSVHLVELSAAVLDKKVVLAGMPNESTGCVLLGLGVDDTIVGAAARAVNEFLAAVYWHEALGCDDVAMPEVSSSREWLRYHHALTRTDKDVRRLLGMLLASGEDQRSATHLPRKRMVDLDCSYVDLPSRTRSSVVVRANCEMLLPLAFGPEYQNLRPRFLKDRRIFDSLEKLEIHPVDRFLAHPFD